MVALVGEANGGGKGGVLKMLYCGTVTTVSHHLIHGTEVCTRHAANSIVSPLLPLTCSSTHPDTGLCARLDLGFCLLLLGVFSSLGSARLQTHICSDEPHPGLTACDDGHKGYFVRRGGTRSGVQEC